MKKYHTNSELNELMSEGTGHFCFDYVNDYEATRDVFDYGLNDDEKDSVMSMIQWHLARDSGKLINRTRCIAILIATGMLGTDFTVFAGYKKKEESRCHH